MACTRPLNAYQTPSGKVLFTPHPDSTFIQLARPHYHLVLFNHDFYDKVLFKSGKFGKAPRHDFDVHRAVRSSW